jgi:hypothetical protein
MKKSAIRQLENQKEKLLRLSDPEDIWELHDYLSGIRKEIDNKCDYRYSVLVMIFANLLKQQWLKFDNREGLSADNID